MSSATMSDTVASTTAERWSFAQYLFVFALVVACFIALDLGDGQLHNGDADDLLRAIQGRTFLETGNWYDMTLPMVHAPEAYVSAWSRLVDLPYAVIALALRAVVGPEQAIEMAFRIWPPAMGLMFSWLVVVVLRRVFPLKTQLPVSCLFGIAILMPYAIWEYSPDRIDHHGVQILLLLTIAYGLARFDTKGGIAIGIAVPVAAAIGLETLPVLGMALVATAAAWWFDMRDGSGVLRVTGIACAATTLALMVALIPPSAYFTLHNDAFSAPYIQLLVGFGLLAALLPALLPRKTGPLVRLGTFAGFGLVVIAAVLLQYPALLHGPFPMIDALTHRYWFDGIQQEMTVLLFFQIRNWTGIALVAAMWIILLLSVPAVLVCARKREAALPALYAFLWAALLMTCIANRFLRLALAIVPLMLPIALGEAMRLLHASRGLSAMLAKIAVTVTAAAVVIVSLAALVPEKRDVNDAFDYLLMRSCEGEDFSATKTLSGVRIMTPPAIGLRIIMQKSDDISVSSIPFHRSSPAISRVIQTFMATTTAERMALMKDFDYLAVCRSPRGLPNENSLPLFAALMADEKVPGLEPMPASKPSNFMLFRIDKTVTE